MMLVKPKIALVGNPDELLSGGMAKKARNIGAHPLKTSVSQFDIESFNSKDRVQILR
jgi:hypothetical protein